jgi:hypothetical protein
VVVLRTFERRLERLVEGVMARAFRSGVRPVELGRRLVRTMDNNRTVGVSGRTMVPNHFTVRLSPDDAAAFAGMRDVLVVELANAAREHARDENYGFAGPVAVELVVEQERRAGTFAVDGALRQGSGGVGAGALVLADGSRLALGDGVVRIGRLPECEIQLADTNASRIHAEVRPRGEGFVLVDLGSTNGSQVNGARVTQRVLRDGDRITIGVTVLIFEAS